MDPTLKYKSMSLPYKEFRMKEAGLGRHLKLKSAKGICIEPDSGRVYIVERGNSRIQVFSPEGDHLFLFHPERAYTDLWGISIRGGLVVVSDYQGGMIYVFTLDGELISEFGQGFSRKGVMIKLSQPMGLAIAENGEIYICEFGASKLLVLTHEQNLDNICHIKTTEKPHDVLLPKTQTGPMLLTSNNIVCEERMYSFTNFSCFSWFGSLDTNGNLILSDSKNYRIMIFEMKKGYPEVMHTISMKDLGMPMGVAVDKLGRIICVTSKKIYFFK